MKEKATGRQEQELKKELAKGVLGFGVPRTKELVVEVAQDIAIDRAEKNVGQREIAEELKLSVPTISNWLGRLLPTIKRGRKLGSGNKKGKK